ncbi:MAG: OmpA family protein [Pseudomonadota bacterium]
MKLFNIGILLFSLTLTFGCGRKDQCLYVESNHQEWLQQGYQQKVENLLVIFDASSSMWDTYNGTQKFQQSRNIVLGLNQGISSLKLQAGLHIIGESPATHDTLANDGLIYGMTAYNPGAFAHAVNSISVKGLTPISTPLLTSRKTLQDTNGQIALIVISDGMQVSSNTVTPQEAATRLKAAYGDRLCIYTVLIGNTALGHQTMDAVTKAGECGFTIAGDTLSTSSGMNDFIRQVFFEKKTTAPVSFLLNVQFDLDRAVIRPDAHDNLDEIGTFLTAHPQIAVTLEGHTCDIGSERHNKNLSQQRAASVKRYLVEKFRIDPVRLSTIGYGFSHPVATNVTEEGRQRNRRVMATIHNQ